jgi:hypothetical protein
MAVTTVAIVNDRALRAIVTSRGGDANIWANRVAGNIKDAAVRAAPVGAPRVGEAHRHANLKHSHFRNGVIWRGRGIRAEGSIINNASYALYVHRGVQGKIFPHGRAFVIPKSSFLAYTGNAAIARRAGTKGTHMRWANPVSGQKANPWLQRAATQVIARTGA